MSRLQRKAVRMVIWLYLVVLALGTLLSYFVVLRPLKREAIQRYKNQNEYMREEMDSRLQVIEEYVNFIAYSGHLQEALIVYEKDPKSSKAQYRVSSVLNTLCYVKTGIRSIAVDSGQSTLYSLIPPTEKEKKLLQKDWYKNIGMKAGNAAFSKGFFVEQENGRMIKAQAYSKHFKNHKVEFTVTVFFDFTENFGKIERMRSNEFEKSYWMTPQRQSLFDDLETDEEKKVRSVVEKGKEIVEMDQGVYFISRLYRYPYISVTYVSEKTLYYVFSEYIQMILLFLTGFFIVSLVSVLWIIRRITTPVYELASVMSEAVGQDLNVHLMIHEDDEIGDLSRIFNQMMMDLKVYVNERIQREKREQEMRFGLLVSQVDPHFVCNTLNTIHYLAIQKRHEDVVVVNSALANILRDRLRLKDFCVYDSVKQEIDTVQSYLRIQKYRYGEMVTVTWNVEEVVLECLIPKNIIQPLVENAILHGLADENSGEIAGNIVIEVKKQEDRLVIGVADDGCGMSQEKAQKLETNNTEASPKGRGIGICGIRERLELLYPDEYYLHIKSEEGKGTAVRIEIMEEFKNENSKDICGIQRESFGD